MPYFHLISWCRNFAFAQNFRTRKLGEIKAFHAVKVSITLSIFYNFYFLYNIYIKGVLRINYINPLLFQKER